MPGAPPLRGGGLRAVGFDWYPERNSGETRSFWLRFRSDFWEQEETERTERAAASATTCEELAFSCVMAPSLPARVVRASGSMRRVRSACPHPATLMNGRAIFSGGVWRDHRSASNQAGDHWPQVGEFTQPRALSAGHIFRLRRAFFRRIALKKKRRKGDKSHFEGAWNKQWQSVGTATQCA